MLSYELCKQLKEAGFPQEGEYYFDFEKDKNIFVLRGIESDYFEGIDKILCPTLSELIEACGDNLWYSMGKINEMYVVIKDGQCFQGTSREEAVANLWLELNKK
jgi:hypothetical protein